MRRTGWRRYLFDEFVIALGAILLLAWLGSAFTALTGLSYGRRGGFYRVSQSYRDSVWYLAYTVTAVVTPFLLWRLLKLKIGAKGGNRTPMD